LKPVLQCALHTFFLDQLLMDVSFVLDLDLAQSVEVLAAIWAAAVGILAHHHICCFAQDGADILAGCCWLLLLLQAQNSTIKACELRIKRYYRRRRQG
jgi:hypothetical protein